MLSYDWSDGMLVGIHTCLIWVFCTCKYLSRQDLAFRTGRDKATLFQKVIRRSRVTSLFSRSCSMTHTRCSTSVALQRPLTTSSGEMKMKISVQGMHYLALNQLPPCSDYDNAPCISHPSNQFFGQMWPKGFVVCLWGLWLGSAWPTTIVWDSY